MVREKEDIKTLLACAGVILLTWLVFLGWSPGLLISGHDGALNIPYFQDIMSSRGRWWNFLYDPSVLGGIVVHDISGTLPLFQLLGALGVSGITALNLLDFFIQLGLGFLGTRAVLDLAHVWSDASGAPSWPFRVGCAWLCAFTPAVAWRIYYGHWMILLGLFIFLVALSLGLAALTRNLSITLVLVAFAMLSNTFPSTAHQAELYSVVFGGPILFGALWPRGGWTRGYALRLAVPFGVPIAAFWFSMLKFSGMLAQATGADSGRSLGGAQVTYSYLTATLRDWLTSIPWSLAFMPQERDHLFWHEINYGLGPLLLALLLVPWRKAWRLGVGLALSLGMTLFFSMDLHPLSDLLLAILSPLKSFRVPERAILPFAVILPVIAAATLRVRFGDPLGPRPALVAVGSGLGAALLLLVPTVPREFLSWAILLGLVGVAWFLGGGARWRPTAAVAVVVLGVLSVGAFGERRIPFSGKPALVDEPRRIGIQARNQAPDLEFPLTRINFRDQLPTYAGNTAHATGLSTLNGYWNPPLRFLNLTAAISGYPPMPTAMYFDFAPEGAAFATLRQLYNIRFSGTLGAGGIFVEEWGKTGGPAWFSEKVLSEPTFEALGRTLASAGTDLAAMLPKRLWVVANDPIFQKDGVPEIAPGCGSAKLFSVDARRGTPGVRIRLQSPGECPLTVAMNYARQLKAYAMENGEPGRGLRIFPSYGALTGVLVPRDVKEVLLIPEPTIPLWAWGVFLSGCLFAAALLWWTPRLNRIEP